MVYHARRFGRVSRVRSGTEPDGPGQCNRYLLYAVWEEIVSEVGILVDEKYFPDPTFRQWVRVDPADGDILSEEEITNTTSISLNGVYSYYGEELFDLTGFGGNDISEIGLSMFPNFTEFWAGNNQSLSNRNFTVLPDLAVVSVDNCGMTSLDLTKTQSSSNCMRCTTT